MEHHNITTGFEGGSSETRLRDEGWFASSCYEFTIAHINVYPHDRLAEFRHGQWSRQTEWSTTTAGTTLQFAQNLRLPGEIQSIGRLVDPGNLLKLCACMTTPDRILLAAGLAAKGLPNGGGKWTTLNNIIGLLISQGFNISPPDATHPHDPAELTQYIYFSYKYVCGPKCKVAKCKCKDKKSVMIDINEKTKEYTASDGTKIKLTDPGDFKKAVEQIVKAESKIKLDCAKGDGDDV